MFRYGKSYVETVERVFQEKNQKFPSKIRPILKGALSLENIISAWNTKTAPDEFIEYFRLARSFESNAQTVWYL